MLLHVSPRECGLAAIGDNHDRLDDRPNRWAASDTVFCLVTGSRDNIINDNRGRL
jgi:hypothetical protein